MLLLSDFSNSYLQKLQLHVFTQHSGLFFGNRKTQTLLVALFAHGQRPSHEADVSKGYLSTLNVKREPQMQQEVQTFFFAE